MIIMRALKTELDLNNVQKTACIVMPELPASPTTGDWAKKEAFLMGKDTHGLRLAPELNRLKKSELSWMYEVSKCAPQEALRDLDRAFVHFFRRVREKRAGKKYRSWFPQVQIQKEWDRMLPPHRRIHVFERTINYPG